LERLYDRALGENLLAELREVLQLTRKDRSSLFQANAESTKKSVALVCALYAARRISKQEYVFLAVSPIESLNEANVFNGDLAVEVRPISDAMRELEERYDAVWLRGEGPKEYWDLDKKFLLVVENKLRERLRTFGLHDLAQLKETNPAEFDRLHERGRRSIFHKEEYVHALRDIVLRYEEDAKRAARAKAFSAAVTLLGAGIEGMLVLRCLRSRNKAFRVGQRLPRRVRPSKAYADKPMNWRFETLIEVCLHAGWLPPIATSSHRLDSATLAHLLRLMRNQVHPGKHAKEKPWVETDERDYNDAEAIYQVLMSTLTGNIRTAIS
jgi:hypothetical protein